jgi:hypothetical protein
MGTRLRLALASALLAGCGGGNSSVQDLGATLNPKSEVFASGTLLGIIPITAVVITDADDLCGSIPAPSACSTSSSTSPTGFPVSTANLFEIAGIATGSGTYAILQADAGASGALGGVAVVFSRFVDGQDAGTDQAVSGTVTFSSLKAGSSASGNYDVVMQSGAHLSGNFSANDCAALDKLLTTSSGAECGSSYSGDTCTGSCTCNSQMVTADCSQPDGGQWQCTCTSANGQVTTCTMASTVAAADACQSGSTCCPESF